MAKVGDFELKRWRHVIHVAFGGILMGVMLAMHFGKFYGGL